MRRTSVPARVAAAGAVVVAGLLLVGVSGCSAHPTDAMSKLAHLDEGTIPSVDLDPPVVPGVDDRIVPTSLRLLTKADDHSFWVGVTRDDRVCFIADPTSGPTIAGTGSAADAETGSVATAPDGAATPGASLVAVSTAPDGTLARCLDADRFGAWGATLRLGSPERTYWLHTEYMTVDPGWTELSANIAVRD